MFSPLMNRKSRRTKSEQVGDLSSTRIISLSHKFTQQKQTLASDGSGPITILVGSNKVPFTLNREQLCKESAYFATSLGAAWNQNDKTEVHLEDLTENVFRLIADWLSEGRVRTYKRNDTENALGRTEYWRQTLQFYLAADYLMMPKLMNDIVDMDACEHRDYNFKDGKHEHVRFWTLQAVVEALQYNIKDTPYFNFMLDSCVYGLRHGKSVDQNSIRQQLSYLQDLYPEVIVDLTMRSLREEGDNEWKEPNPWFNHFRDYHVHAEGEKCGGSLGN